MRSSLLHLTRICLTIIATAFLSSSINAQFIPISPYLNNVQEDALPYFFSPVEFAPLQTGALSDVARNFSDHPLAGINRNPASINSFESDGYFYADVKTLPSIDQQIIYEWQCVYCYYTVLPTNNKPRQIQEPFLTTAIFFKPIEDNSLWLGLSYQFLKFSEPFYQVNYAQNVPFDVARFAESSSIFQGEDYFDKTGHTPTLYAGYSLTDAIDLGIKVSYNIFSGSGNSISENFASLSDIDPYSTIYEQNSWRSTNYKHWDIEGGLNLRLSDRFKGALSLGFLTGNFRQTGNRIWTSDIYNDNPALADDFYSRESDHTLRNGFNRDGNTYYATAEFSWELDSESKLDFVYNVSNRIQDFASGEADMDFTFDETQTLNSENEELYMSNEVERHSVYESAGELNGWHHNLGTFITKHFGDGYTLTTGLQLQLQLYNENLARNIDILNTGYNIERVGDAPPVKTVYSTSNEFQSRIESNQSTLQGYLPLMLGKTFNQYLTLELGVLAQRQNTIVKRNLQGDGYGIWHYADTNHRVEHATSHYNAFASIAVSPTDNVSFRFLSFTDRRQIAFSQKLQAFRFRFTTEIAF